MCQGHECGNQQPIRVISSSVYAVHAVYAIDAVQQAAGAPVSRHSIPRLVQPHLESTLAIAERLASKPEPLRCIWLSHLLQSRSHSTACQAQHDLAVTADWRVPRP